jgi:hypothetical protein
MGHYSRECLNLSTLVTKKNVGFFIRRYSIEKKGKTQVYLIEPMNERREKALMGLLRSFKILEDVINVMARTKRPAEDTSHPVASIKRFKEMAKGPKRKEKKRTEGGGLDSKTFQFLEILVLIQW